MRTRLVILALSVLGIALATSTRPAYAAAGCPGTIYWPNTPWHCTNTKGSDCSACTYSCNDGNTYEWNMCTQTQ